MEMPINTKPPTFMHVDLNSCFAIVEQQANALIRHKPVAIAAYDTPGGMIIASSYEAKALGIKLGVSVSQARQIFPGTIILMPDPDKYFDVHKRFKEILLSYTDQIYAKSVDEFLIDFKGSLALKNKVALEEIGQDIKNKVKQVIGEYVTINIGIATNPFNAKLAAGLHKPDGMDRIDSSNLRAVYKGLELLDLPGINYRYQARLNLAGIYTPIDFLDASLPILRKEVFRSIVGYYWYLRLRGYPIDLVDFSRKSFRAQYALAQKTADINELAGLLMKLSEKVGRRMRAQRYSARGIKLFLRLADHSYFMQSKKMSYNLYSSVDIYKAAFKLLKLNTKIVREISVSVYALNNLNYEQENLFQSSYYNPIKIANAMDQINDRYGEYMISSALMANMQNVIIKRVAFGKNDQ